MRQIIAQTARRGANWAPNAPRIGADTACMLSTRSATALYVGAVLGPGVLLLPALAAEVAGPGVDARLGRAARAVGPAGDHVRRARHAPARGGRDRGLRARRVRPRAGAVTGWWFLSGVVVGAPAVALIGGFYVAELLGAGRAGAVVAAARDDRRRHRANAAGLHTTARAQLALAGLLAALLLVAVVTALPHSRGRELDAVRARTAGPRSAPPRAC